MLLITLLIFSCIHSIVCPTPNDAPARPINVSLKNEERLDVWILIGQSNLVGDNGYDRQPMPRELEPLPDKVFAWSVRWNTWEPAMNNIAMRSHGLDTKAFVSHQRLEEYVSLCAGPELAFARTLISLKVSSHIGFIPLAEGGRSLTTLDCVNCSGYRDLLYHVKNAIEDFKGPAVLRGVLFAQGEVEATSAVFCQQCPELALRWQQEFKALLSALRRDLSDFYHHRLPVVMGVISEREGIEGDQEAVMKGLKVYLGNITLIRNQQLGVEAEDLLKVDQQAFAYFRQSWGVEVGRILLHVSKIGQAALGKLYALEYYLWLQSHGHHGSPHQDEDSQSKG